MIRVNPRFSLLQEYFPTQAERRLEWGTLQVLS